MSAHDPLHSTYVRADRLMVGILWVLAVFSFCLAPWHRTWGAALAIAIPAAVIPTFLAYAMPGSLATRLAVAASLMGFCALNIHQARGMTELHFGIFVLLAGLLCYRDWRPIVTAAGVAAVHHLSFSWLQQQGFGGDCFTTPGLGIVLAHAAYVIVETSVLAYIAVVLHREGLQAAELQDMIERMTARDGKVDLLAKQSGRNSEAGRAFAGIVARVRSTISSIAAGIDTVAEAANAVAHGGEELEQRTQAQSSALARTSQTLRELTTIVRGNEQQARQANDLVASAVDVAARGGQVVSQVVETMGEISRSSTRIADITGVIDEIAFQTNLLALNAAVEAARAGDQGRGFAVVASEVRNLAQRSATAAREIKALIDTSVSSVEKGNALVDEAGVTIAEVVKSVGKVTQIAQDFHRAAREQSAGIDQVNQAVSQMEQITQQNTTLVESMAESADRLREQGGDLMQAVSRFETGQAAEQAPQPTSHDPAHALAA